MNDFKPTLAVDLDGTILDIDLDRWQEHGMNYFGTPKPQAKEVLDSLRGNGWRIIIHTCRLNPTINTDATGEEAKKKVEEVLDKHDIPYNEVYTRIGKPLAEIYIDDRGLRFESWVQVLRDVGMRKVG